MDVAVVYDQRLVREFYLHACGTSVRNVVDF
jgi:hypothetical protein